MSQQKEAVKQPAKKATFRPYREGDQESLVLHANNRKIWANLRDLFPHPYTKKDADWWINFNLQEAKEKKPLSYAICIDDKVVGGIGLTPGTDVERRDYEIGYWLGEQFWGQGYMSQIGKEFIEYAWKEFPEMARIHAAVYEFNVASKRLLEKLGFTFEGRLRKHYFKDGKLIDGLLYALIRPGLE